MTVTVASGKGGTGKTTVALSLARAAGRCVLADCDADAPNAALFLRTISATTSDVCVRIPRIDESRCTFCGLCAEVCAFHALAVAKPLGQRLGSTLVFEALCHGCGACARLCPQGAITEEDVSVGIVDDAYAGALRVVTGRLKSGAVQTPAVIRATKAFAQGSGLSVIVDAPPGSACAMVAAVRGSDHCVLVTEPTPFGLHDLDGAVKVCRELGVPCSVVINRSCGDDPEITAYCAEQKIPIVLRLPFSEDIAQRCAKGKIVADISPVYFATFCDLWKTVSKESRCAR